MRMSGERPLVRSASKARVNSENAEKTILRSRLEGNAKNDLFNLNGFVTFDFRE